jgi:two-component system sensor histidine kinase CiaH
MAQSTRRQLRRITIIYWTLLVYIIAALVWWFITLERQNSTMFAQRQTALERQKSELTQREFDSRSATIDRELSRNTAKYVGEGITFLILILIGAAFVFRSIRRQFQLQQQQQNFMMAVTHELKTPISIARLNLETLQKYSLDPEKQKKLIRMTLEETSRLNFLTNNILIASQLEAGGYQNAKEDLDLSGLLKDCMHDFRARFPERIFEEEIEADADVKGDPLLLQILINNLVENAIKYSPKGPAIIARLRTVASKIELRIEDNGPGIPDAEKSKVFTKFYRVGNENTRKAQGTGLGLYLCRIIAKAHNADISVTNNVPHGSTFAVVFRK